MLVSSTTELIEKLQDYEKRNGVGAIRSIDFYLNGNRKTNYILRIANGSCRNEFEDRDRGDERFQEESIEISAVDDELLFSHIT